ncbi:MAG TPA: glucose-1-phosphate adenylyltransferase subunit GlgD [Firmicutes bacterium]|nr:glucose-1-phosphate adenylyltransferase subunit GlgD [Bacillota bacterium]
MSDIRKAVGIVFANMHDELVKDLTSDRTMGSVPFGGRYRLVDFPLSNMVNAGITKVGLITKANYQSLMDHVGSGRDWDLTRKREGLHILPPYGGHDAVMYRGKIEALAGALSFLRHSQAEYVIMSDCDTILNMDFREMLDVHLKSGADLTVAYAHATLLPGQSRNTVLFEVDETRRVTSVLCGTVANGPGNISLNIMVAGKSFLEELVQESMARGYYNLDRDILQRSCGEIHIQGYEFKGYFRKIQSTKSFYDANMDLLNRDVRAQLFPENRAIYTKVRDEAPVRYGMQAAARNCLIADGCTIEGEVENSIIFRGVYVQKGARVRNSILMQGTVVGQKSDIQYMITDKDVTITDYRTIAGSFAYPVFVSKGSVI